MNCVTCNQPLPELGDKVRFMSAGKKRLGIVVAASNGFLNYYEAVDFESGRYHTSIKRSQLTVVHGCIYLRPSREKTANF